MQKKSERGGARKKMKRGEGKGRKLRNILPGWKPREKERSICHVSHFISKKSIRAFLAARFSFDDSDLYPAVYYQCVLFLACLRSTRSRVES